MSILKRILIIFFLLIPISVSFANVTFKQQLLFFEDQQNINGLAFNEDGSKFFTITSNVGDEDHVTEWNLSTPYDISTRSYAGDSERCFLDAPDDVNQVDAGDQGATGGGDIAFSSDGLTMLTTNRGTNGGKNDFVLRFDLTTAYDISTCQYISGRYIDTDALQTVDTFDLRAAAVKHHLSGIAIKPDGTKIFLNFNDSSGTAEQKDKDSIKEYTLSTPFDLSTMTVEPTAIQLNINDNPEGMSFSNDGKKLFLGNKTARNIEQYSLPTAYSLVGAVKDGTFKPLNSTGGTIDISGLTFNAVGLKLYIASQGSEIVFEYDLQCPFTIIGGTCPPISENSDRTGVAEAQVIIAKKTIDHSTKTALNRLKWIRRNKDKQDLTNLNLNFDFTNQRLASLSDIVKASIPKKKIKDKDQDIFYWSEGSISVGKIGDTTISSAKEINTNRITVGADKFLNNKGLRGLAFSVGRNNIDVGNAGSKVDADNFNITYYSTSAIKNDEKFIDTVFGIGKIHSDILTVLDGNELTANRRGKQIFGTIRIKDEIKKNNFIFIPSGRFDIGHTLLDDYEEVGVGGIIVEKQHVRTKNLRASLTAVEDISNDKYTIKRHGKIEYRADIDRSSDFKYKYKGGSGTFTDTLHVGALHNISGELGIDIVFPDNYSIFIIYERDQAIDYGHTDNLHIAIGYLPDKNTNYSIQLDSIDNTKSNYVISKNINDFLIDFKLTNHLMRPDDYEEASFNLSRKF